MAGDELSVGLPTHLLPDAEAKREEFQATNSVIPTQNRLPTHNDRTQLHQMRSYLVNPVPWDASRDSSSPRGFPPRVVRAASRAMNVAETLCPSSRGRFSAVLSGLVGRTPFAERRFLEGIMSSPTHPVVESNGQRLHFVVRPVAANPSDETWTDAKNHRRSELIDREIEGDDYSGRVGREAMTAFAYPSVPLDAVPRSTRRIPETGTVRVRSCRPWHPVRPSRSDPVPPCDRTR
jgi:hypothetical protein